MNPQSFRYRQEGPVVTLTLDRPQRMNALTFEVYEELTATFRRLAEGSTVRAVVITGAGSAAFCTGGDVQDIIGRLLERSERELLEFTELTCDLIRSIRALPCPVIASLNGTVAGAGAAIALAADFRVAATTAKIAFLFVRVGLAGADMGCAHLLPRLVGLGRATELLMLGDFLPAEDALRIGLYHRVVAPEALAAETQALADRLVRGPAAALAETKRALEAEMHMGLEQALAGEARIQAALMSGPDFAEGFQAFRERRSPRFQGAPE